MNESEAQEWAAARFGPEVVVRLDEFAAIVREENERQNLIAPSTVGAIWSRHIVDSLQLLPLAGGASGLWVDIGTGAGFPGLAIAAASPDRDIVLIEPRRLRADYLKHAAGRLDLNRVTVVQDRVERIAMDAAIISARAVATIEKLLVAAARCADKETIWLLPKGRSAVEEVAQARQKWHGVFHVEHSLTDPESHIVVASGVRAR